MSGASFDSLYHEFLVSYGRLLLLGSYLSPRGSYTVARGAYCLGFRAAIEMLMACDPENAGRAIVEGLEACNVAMERLSGERDVVVPAVVVAPSGPGRTH